MKSFSYICVKYGGFGMPLILIEALVGPVLFLNKDFTSPITFLCSSMHTKLHGIVSVKTRMIIPLKKLFN